MCCYDEGDFGERTSDNEVRLVSLRRNRRSLTDSKLRFPYYHQEDQYEVGGYSGDDLEPPKPPDEVVREWAREHVRELKRETSAPSLTRTRIMARWIQTRPRRGKESGRLPTTRGIMIDRETATGQIKESRICIGVLAVLLTVFNGTLWSFENERKEHHGWAGVFSPLSSSNPFSWVLGSDASKSNRNPPTCTKAEFPNTH